MNQSNGFSLIELMVTILALAILASIAVPSFQSMIEGRRLIAAAEAIAGIAAAAQPLAHTAAASDAGDSRANRSERRAAERKAAAESKRARKQAARAAREG